VLLAGHADRGDRGALGGVEFAETGACCSRLPSLPAISSSGWPCVATMRREAGSYATSLTLCVPTSRPMNSGAAALMRVRLQKS
jgi:hypothetical protein